MDTALQRQDMAAFLDALNVLVKAERYMAVAQKQDLIELVVQGDLPVS